MTKVTVKKDWSIENFRAVWAIAVAIEAGEIDDLLKSADLSASSPVSTLRQRLRPITEMLLDLDDKTDDDE